MLTFLGEAPGRVRRGFRTEIVPAPSWTWISLPLPCFHSNSSAPVRYSPDLRPITQLALLSDGTHSIPRISQQQLETFNVRNCSCVVIGEDIRGYGFVVEILM